MGRRIGTKILLLVILCLTRVVAGIDLPDFFPFGPQAGDESLPPSNDASTIVNLQQPIAFYGENRNYITIYTDGRLDLQATPQSSFASVYVFSADVDTRSLGQVFYRETNDTILLQAVSSLLSSTFSGPAMKPVSVFVATWFSVGYFDNRDDRANTFQCVLATDEFTTIAVLLYADGMIEWTTGDADGGANGLGGDPADVGFVGDNGPNSFFIPGSNTTAIINIASNSNIATPGLWLFQVDGANISVPELNQCGLELDNCDSNAQCVDLLLGFLCLCNPGFTGNGVTCSCIVAEFGFINTQYTFIEDAGPQLLQITIQNAVTLDRDLSVIVNTNNLNAIANFDYKPLVNVEVMFRSGSSQGTMQTVSVGILNDNRVEDNESFQAILSPPAGEPAVVISADQGTTTVTIDSEDRISTTTRPRTQLAVTYDAKVLRGNSQSCLSGEQHELLLNQIDSELAVLLEGISQTIAAMNTGLPPCGAPGWTRVAFLDMTDPSEQCPSPLRLYTTPTRACGRAARNSGSCSSVVYSTGSQSYRLVCGRIIGYQVATPDALFRFNTRNPPPTIDQVYVDGVSITHGLPRNHIWTFVAGKSENDLTSVLRECPCANSQGNAATVPHFVGNNYFCEAGNVNFAGNIFYVNDPLWDGQSCGPTSQCCTFNSPPWFTAQLPSPTSDDIEVRICGDQSTSDEDSPIELLELYVY